ncbi:MAG: glycerophosphodiester phosphodiesterase [Bacteroidota bacterium]
MMKKWSFRFLLIVGSALLAFPLLFVVLGGGFIDAERNLSMENHQPLIFAHRGIPSFPENGKTGIKESLALNFKAIELDVRTTKDGHLVLFHDASGKRLLGMDRNIDEVTLAVIQKGFIIRDQKVSTDKVLTLAEMTDSFPQFDHIYLDIKANNLSIAKQLLHFLEQQPKKDKFLIASTNFIFLSYLRLQNPDIITVLEGFQSGKHWWYPWMPKNFEPDFYACSVGSFDEAHLRFLKKHHLLKRKIVYGVKHQNFKKVLEYGITHIIVDFHPY